MTKVLRIEQRVRTVNGQRRAHSDVFIEHEGRVYYTRYWWEVADTPHMRAAEVQQFLHRREHWKAGAA